MAGIEKIGALAAKVGALAAPEWRRSFCNTLSEVTLQQIDDCYKERRDPYGNAWEPTKQPNPILEKTGAFRRSWHKAQVGPDGFRVSSDVPYGVYQEYGTSRITPRMTIPLAARGLGPIWASAYQAIARRALNEALK